MFKILLTEILVEEKFKSRCEVRYVFFSARLDQPPEKVLRSKSPTHVFLTLCYEKKKNLNTLKVKAAYKE